MARNGQGARTIDLVTLCMNSRRLVESICLLFLLLTLLSACSAAQDSSSPVALSAKLSVTADGWIQGRVKVQSSREWIEFDAVGFQKVKVRGIPRRNWSYDGRTLRVKSGGRDFRIDYRTRPKKGLKVHSTAIWTAFHTWHWLPSFIDPSIRVTLSLEVDGPRGWTSLTTGDRTGRGSKLALSIPHPSYVLGFALLKIADFHESKSSGQILRTFGAGSHALIISQRTSEAAQRFDQAFGFKAAEYVTVFLPGNTKQELAGMTFLPRKYLRTVQQNPSDDWLLVHEYAHQAFGNLVTCKTWGDFWLNEGLVVWWVGYDKFLRGDEEGFQREKKLWFGRVQRHLAESSEVRVHRPGIDVEKSGGSLVYNGGALVVEEVAQLVGIDIFLSNLADVIRNSKTWGRSITTLEWLKSHLPPGNRARILRKLKDAREL